MRGIVVGAAAVALVCASCSGSEGETVEITTTDSAGQPTVITQQVTEEPQESPPADAAPTTADLVGQVFDTPGGAQIAIDLPQDWTIEPLGEAVRTNSPIADAVSPKQWCLVPPTAPPAIDGCSGVLLAAGGDWLPGAGGTAYSPRQADGWRSTPGPLPCPFGPDGEPVDSALVTSTPDAVEATAAPDGSGTDSGSEVPAESTPDESEVDLLITASEGLPLTSVQTTVDGRTLTYETWRASCSLSQDVVITPQVWHDRELDVLIRDYFGIPETAIIVESLRGA